MSWFGAKAVYIKNIGENAFRSGDKAKIVGVVMFNFSDGLETLCYDVLYDDGYDDLIPIKETVDNAGMWKFSSGNILNLVEPQ